MITRREFVAGVACCAVVAGKLGSQESAAANNENLVAPCGTYCGACPMYLDSRENNIHQRTTRYFAAISANKPPVIAKQQPDIAKKPPDISKQPSDIAKKPAAGAKKPAGGGMQVACDGCLGGGQVSGHVPACAIRTCAATKTESRRCAECAEFPCSTITALNNNPHHAELLDNLHQLRSMGIKEWAKHEDDRWRCAKCRAMLSWYDPECP